MDPIVISFVQSYDTDNRQAQSELVDYLVSMWMEQLKQVYFKDYGGKKLVERTASSFIMQMKYKYDRAAYDIFRKRYDETVL